MSEHEARETGPEEGVSGETPHEAEPDEDTSRSLAHERNLELTADSIVALMEGSALVREMNAADVAMASVAAQYGFLINNFPIPDWPRVAEAMAKELTDSAARAYLRHVGEPNTGTEDKEIGHA